MADIFFSDEAIRFFRETKDEKIVKYIRTTLEAADRLRNMPTYSEDELHGTENGYASQHENYRKACSAFDHHILALIFAYDYTGDESYFTSMREKMMAYASYERWHGRGWVGKGELVTASFCAGMALAYIKFRDKLTAEERAHIVDGTSRLGIHAILDEWLLPGKMKLHAIDTMGHNWWSVCVSTAAMAAIAMKDDITNGEKLVKQAALGMKTWWDYPGNPINAKPATLDNGSFYESVSYYDYAICEYLRFSDLHERVFGTRPFDDAYILEGATRYFINTFYPSSVAPTHLPFGDTHALERMRCAPYLAAQDKPGNKMCWYVRYFESKNEKPNLGDGEYESVRLMNYARIYEGEVLPPENTSVCYDGIGWAVFRDTYSEDGTLLALKCGDTWNHAHADAGSFVLYRGGKQEICDSLTCDYGSPLYLSYFCASEAHNVVLFNGKGQDRRDIFTHARNRGHVYNFTDEDGFKYVAADASGPMGHYFRRHLRHFLWLGDFILIYDDIEAYEAGEVSFLLHAEKNNCFRMLTPCEVSEKKGWCDHGRSETTYLSYDMKTDENGRAKFVSVLCLNDALKPVMTEIQNGMKIECGGAVVYINILSDGRIMHRNCIAAFDGITTDAVALVIRDGRYGVVNGSIVRRDDVSFLDTIERVNGWVDGKTPEWLL